MDTSRGHNGTHKRDACVSSLQTEEERERHKKGVGKLELITGCPPEGSRENSQSKTAVLRYVTRNHSIHAERFSCYKLQQCMLACPLFRETFLHQVDVSAW